MRKNRFFIEQNFDDKDEILITDPEIIHQIFRVLRLKCGQPIVLFNNTGQEFHGIVKEKLKKSLRISKEKLNSLSTVFLHNISLYACLLKADKFDWVIQKATELGVSKIFPIISERTEKTGFNLERSKKISKEASEQSGQVFLTEIFEPIKLIDVFGFFQNDFKSVFVLDSSGEKISELKNVSNEINIFVGPEGGWSEKEKAFFDENRLRKISVSKNVLRAETASIVAVHYFSLFDF